MLAQISRAAYSSKVARANKKSQKEDEMFLIDDKKHQS